MFMGFGRIYVSGMEVYYQHSFYPRFLFCIVFSLFKY